MSAAIQKMDGAQNTVADPMISMIERVMMNPDLPMERITAIMDMRERQMDKEAEQAFNRDFASAMAEMPDIPRSGENVHLKTRYSTLDDLIRTTRPVLARHGLSLNWLTVTEGGEVRVTAVVRHALGHQISTTLSGPKDNGKQMNALQGGGSSETYLKRYTGFGILGLSSGDGADDDGQSFGRGSPINEAQFMEIQGLIEDAGITADVVCNAEKLPALHDLPAKDFARVSGKLRATIANRRPSK